MKSEPIVGPMTREAWIHEARRFCDYSYRQTWAYGELLGPRCAESLLPPTRIVSIGPTTSAALRGLDWRIDAEASKPGIAGLIDAVLDCCHAT